MRGCIRVRRLQRRPHETPNQFDSSTVSSDETSGRAGMKPAVTGPSGGQHYCAVKLEFSAPADGLVMAVASPISGATVIGALSLRKSCETVVSQPPAANARAGAQLDGASNRPWPYVGSLPGAPRSLMVR